MSVHLAHAFLVTCHSHFLAAKIFDTAKGKSVPFIDGKLKISLFFAENCHCIRTVTTTVYSTAACPTRLKVSPHVEAAENILLCQKMFSMQ